MAFESFDQSLNGKDIEIEMIEINVNISII